MMVTIKFDQIAMRVSECFQLGQVVVATFLDFDTGAGKVVSINDDTQEVGLVPASEKEASDHINKTTEHLLDEVMTVSEVAKFLHIPYSSLAQAVREGRVQARQSGQTWLTTIAAVQQAVAEGKLRPQN